VDLADGRTGVPAPGELNQLVLNRAVFDRGQPHVADRGENVHGQGFS
jgi:hypothetical protein